MSQPQTIRDWCIFLRKKVDPLTGRIWSLRDIAAHQKVAHTTVRYHLRRAGMDKTCPTCGHELKKLEK